MKLVRLQICNFQCFGSEPTMIDLEKLTFLIGPNGAGKTAALQALARMFGFETAMRRIRRTDFHVSVDGQPATTLWIQADFQLPEAADESGIHRTVPPMFAHMWIESADGDAILRVRLTATIAADGAIEEKIQHIVREDASGNPISPVDMARSDRNLIQVHYLPARRDPADQISYAATTLLGRALRAMGWSEETTEVERLAKEINETLIANPALTEIEDRIVEEWRRIYPGAFLQDAEVSFVATDVDAVLRMITLAFSPSPDGETMTLQRLSDGQKSLLYVSVVMGLHQVGQHVLSERDLTPSIQTKCCRQCSPWSSSRSPRTVCLHISWVELSLRFAACRETKAPRQ